MNFTSEPKQMAEREGTVTKKITGKNFTGIMQLIAPPGVWEVSLHVKTTHGYVWKRILPYYISEYHMNATVNFFLESVRYFFCEKNYPLYFIQRI